MNFENGKISKLRRLLINLADEQDLKNNDKYVAL